METMLRTEHLANGLCLEFIDHSNRYFGDYHRVKIDIRCRIAIVPRLFPEAADPVAEAERVCRRLGEELLWTRSLERMGVAGDDLARVREEMIDSFLRSGSSYLSSPAFPIRFVASKLAEVRSPARPFRLIK